MKFKLKPYEWQIKALQLSDQEHNLALFCEPGTGKTGASINIVRKYCYDAKSMKKVLILAPLVTLHNWKDEFGIHSTIPEHKVAVMSGTKPKKIKEFDSVMFNQLDQNYTHKGIAVCNYESLLTKELFERFSQWEPDVLILDESHYVKSHKSKRYKELLKLATQLHARGGHVILLTGTPILNTPMDIWAQYRIMDGGETFGTNFYVFRNIYFVDENAAWSSRENHFAKYVPRKEMFDDLNRKIYSKAMRVLKKDCIDLPPLIKTKAHIEMTSQQAKMYKEMERDFITYVKDNKGKMSPVVAQVAVTKALRLQQIVTGYVKDEEGNEIEIAGKNPRLDYVKEKLKELTPNHKVILWCSFIKNYSQLEGVCDELGIESVKLIGGQSGTEKAQAIKSFNEDDKVRVIIANRRAGGIGVNLVAASYSIIYSRNFSLGEEIQSEARNHRGGSQIHEKIIKIDLCTKGTIDEKVMEALSKKQKVSDVIIDGILEE